MKVLIVSTNRESLPDPVAPLGAAYVASALKMAGHDVRLLDLQFAPDVHLALKDAYRGFRPHVVGLSIRNVDNVAFPQTVSYVPELAAMVRVLKSAGAKLIIPGGSGFTLMPTELLKALDLNIGIVGEAEYSFPELLRRIEERLPVDGIPGLAYRYGGKYHVNKPRRFLDLNYSPEPDREFIENTLYLSEGGAGNLQTKRGCSFNCAYCSYPLLEGGKVRLRDPARAAAEFELAVRKYGLKHIFIVDNVFNEPAEHAKEFCREIMKRGVRAGWSCYLSPVGFDEELADLMVESGCRGAEFGVDSGVDEILAGLNKSFTAADVARAAAICHRAGLSFCHSLLLGAPGETPATVEQTLDLVDQLKPNAVVAMLGIRILPGTELAARAKAEGVLKDKDPGLKPVFYFPPGLDMNAVSDTLGRYGREHTNFIMPGIHLRMSEKIRQRLRSYGFLGPLWEYLRP